MHKRLGIMIIAVLIITLGWLMLFRESGSAPRLNKTEAPKPSFNKKEFSLDNSSSLWVITNKKRPLNPKDYVPSDLRTPDVALRSSSTSEEMKLRNAAATGLEKMFTAAEKQGISLILASGYRSYNLQNGVYNRYVNTQGQDEADSQSARPGYSEHQTGLAADVGASSRKCEIEACFGNTPEGKWTAANAYKYGFVIRYQEGTQATVGYIYEPWHLRFVGQKLAAEIHRQGNPTLEDFFDLSAAATY